MKLTAFFLLVFGLHLSANTRSQTITYAAKNADIKVILAAVKKQTGFAVLYDRDALQAAAPVTILAKDLPLVKFLDAVFNGQPLTYIIESSSIIIMEKEKALAWQKSPDAVADSIIDVTGKVVNEKGEGVPAAIGVKGTEQGAVTDENGTFLLPQVKPGSILLVSSVGYANQEVKVKSTRLTVVMKLADNKMDDVVFKGYYSTTERLNTGSVAKVTAKDIERQPVTTPLMALQGRVAGLDITPQNGIAGSSPVIRIRGQNSLRQGTTYGAVDGNLPLYVIDGVQINAAPLRTASGTFFLAGMDPLSTINPANIESIEVLKDADATAIYGSRGANGVILITTKSGASGKLSLEMSAYKGTAVKAADLELLHTADYLAMRKEAYKNDNIDYTTATPSRSNADLTLWDQNRYTDWQHTLLSGKAGITDAQLYASGGQAGNSFRLGGSYHEEGTIFPGSFGFKTLTASAGFGLTTPNKKLGIRFNTDFGYNTNRQFDDGNFLAASYLTPPNAPALYNADGSLNWELFTVGGFTQPGWNNPVGYLLKTHNTKASNILANASIFYKLTREITLRTQVGLNLLNQDERIKTPYASLAPGVDPVQVFAIFGKNERRGWSIEPQLEYEKTIGLHHLNAVAGATFQNILTMYNSTTGSGYAADVLMNSLSFASVKNVGADQQLQYRFNSVFARIGYDYARKYVVNLTARRDGSSRFGQNKPFGNFGAVGAAWIFTEEETIAKALPFLSFGKLRASYGITGNDQIGDYQYLDGYSRPVGGEYQGSMILQPSRLSNADFQWEETKKLEIATSLGLFNDRLRIEAAWYRNRSSNQLVNYVLPVTTGFEFVLRNFGATIQNTGWEFSLRTENIRGSHLSWQTTVNLTIPRNKLVSFPGIENSTYANIYKVGEPLSLMNLFTYKGVDPATGLISFEDTNHDGLINFEDQQLMRALAPVLFGGINNEFQYNGFQLSFLLRGDWSYNKNPHFEMPGTNYNQPVDVMKNRWQKQGDMAEVQRLSQNGSNGSNYSWLGNSDHSFVNAAFLRLETVSLVYNLPAAIIKSLKLQGLKLFVQGKNLFTISGFNGLDPDLSANNDFTIPQLRIITGGIQLKF